MPLSNCFVLIQRYNRLESHYCRRKVLFLEVKRHEIFTEYTDRSEGFMLTVADSA